MGERAAVGHVHAAELVLGSADARIWRRTVRTPELLERNAGDFGPVTLRRGEVQSLVEVDTHVQTRLVNFEEMPQPSAEQSHHGSISVGEPDLFIGFIGL